MNKIKKRPTLWILKGQESDLKSLNRFFSFGSWFLYDTVLKYGTVYKEENKKKEHHNGIPFLTESLLERIKKVD